MGTYNAGSERSHMTDNQLLVRWRAGRGQWLGELLHAESREDRHDVGIVGEVEVQSLVERECRVHLIQRRVNIRRSRGQIVKVVGKSSIELFDIANTNAPRGG